MGGYVDARQHLTMNEQSAGIEHDVTPPVDSLLFLNPNSNHSLRVSNIECLNVSIRRLNLGRAGVSRTRSPVKTPVLAV
jgi:hypothetical protein